MLRFASWDWTLSWIWASRTERVSRSRSHSSKIVVSLLAQHGKVSTQHCKCQHNMASVITTLQVLWQPDNCQHNMASWAQHGKCQHNMASVNTTWQVSTQLDEDIHGSGKYNFFHCKFSSQIYSTELCISKFQVYIENKNVKIWSLHKGSSSQKLKNDLTLACSIVVFIPWTVKPYIYISALQAQLIPARNKCPANLICDFVRDQSTNVSCLILVRPNRSPNKWANATRLMDNALIAR